MGQLEDMNTFVAIVDAGTISQAAGNLGIAKSALSRRLSELESRLNVQLLNRTTRKSSLTDAGRNYYQRARQIITDVDELHAATSNEKAALAGDLKIAAPFTFGLQHLTPAINEFAKLHPGIKFNLNFADHQVDLVEEGYDLAIRIANLKSSSYIARKLSPIKLVHCASPAYLEKYGTPNSPEDLKNHDILGYNINSGSMTNFIDRNNKEHSLRLPAKLISNSGDYLCAACLAGLGISRLPSFMIWQHIKAGSLVEIMPDFITPPLNAYAIYPQTHHLSQRVRVFIDFLAKIFEGKPHWDECIK